MNVLVFDIETIPDVAGGRRLYGLNDDIADEDVARVMVAKRREKTGSEFLANHLQRIVAISVVRRSRDALSVLSIGDEESTEAELISDFFRGLAKYSPVLVSWNGSGFDLPVLNYRSLVNGVDASRYWETGDDDQSFRYNNYISRFHWRHTDLMDVLANFQGRGSAPLDEIATMLGFPGKLGMDGSKVFDTWLKGDLGAIRNYCETDVLNTWLTYLAFQKTRGQLDERGLDAEFDLVRTTLADAGKPHFDEFLAAWSGSSAT